MIKKTLTSSFLIMACTFLLFLHSSKATTVIKMDLDDLVQNSCSIVIGQIEGIEKNWERVPYPKDSYALNVNLKIRVEKVLKPCASIREGEIVNVFRLGGKSEGLELMIPGAPTFTDKTRVLLFLAELPDGRHTITGFSQGKYRILTDAKTGQEVAVQDKNARALILVDQKTGRPSVHSQEKEILLQDLIDQINARLSAGGAQ